MFFHLRPSLGMSLSALLLTSTLLTACEGSKPEHRDGAVPHTSGTPDKPSAQLPGSATYTAFTTISEQRLGVRVYPGAQPRHGGSWQMTDKLDEGAQSLTMATLHSEDELDTVADFYTRAIGATAAQVLRLPTPNGPKISITVENHVGGAINVMLQPAIGESGTLIKITRMTGPNTPGQERQTNQ